MRSPLSTAQFVSKLRRITAASSAPALIATAHFGGFLAAAALLALVLVPIDARVRLGFEDSVHGPVTTASALVFDVFWTGLLLSSLMLVPTALGSALRWPGFFEMCAIATICGLALSAYGVLVRRRWTRVRRVEVTVSGLPRAFDGYRIVQLSDLHIGTMLRAPAARRWAARANALEPDLVAITGDFLSSGTAFHDEVVAVLGTLRARDGVVGCLGNHDYYAEDALCGALGERGVRVLRNEGITITRENQPIFVAGVEDPWKGRPDLAKAVEGANGAAIVLLAHNPDFFPTARDAGVALTLSGHTHAGQLAVPFAVERLNLSRLQTRWSAGLYHEAGSRLFVHAGLGTTGPAIRIGAAPEIVEITLRCGL